MRRPDVLAAERRLAAQSERIGIAEADLYPHISIVGQIGLQSQDYQDLFNWDSTTSSIMPGFKWDVLNYGRLLNKIRVEDARFQESLWDYRNTILLANEEAENSLTEFLYEQVRLRKLAKSVYETEKANELALLQYSEGVADFQRVLDSQAGLVLRQDQAAESRGQVAVNLVMVYKALGGGWQCPCPGSPIPASDEMQSSGELIPIPANPTPASELPTPQVPVLSVPDSSTPEVLPPENAPSAMQPVRPAGPVGSQPQLSTPGTTPLIPSTNPVLSVRPVAAVFPINPIRNPVTPILSSKLSDASSVVPTSYLTPPTVTLPTSGTTVRLPETP